MGLVLQDPFMFYGTVASNIKLYHPTMTETEVKAAAEFVHAHSFIEQLDGGYNHKVIEKGSAFSSGQRQLIAFARTMAINPKILILDEATANIDSGDRRSDSTVIESNACWTDNYCDCPSIIDHSRCR